MSWDKTVRREGEETPLSQRIAVFCARNDRLIACSIGLLGAAIVIAVLSGGAQR